MKDERQIDILCKVVDNLGDIGFAYRLARALSELPDPPCLRLIVDDLAAFASICPHVKADMPLQTVEGFLLVRWDEPGDEALRLFRSGRPRFVLECYACGRPPWFESILFDEDDPLPRTIVNLEYLTAESWAPGFHKLPSLTRSPLVRKSIFMPGLEEGTGGLIQDKAFSALAEKCGDREGFLSVRRSALSFLEANGSPEAHGLPVQGVPPRDFSGLPDLFWFLIFSYEHDFTSIIADLSRFHTEQPLLALVASGRSCAPFLKAWKDAGSPFPVLSLPLMAQQRWDAFLAASDFTVIRGEESFSRACLSGRPFLWQCYPFAEGAGQLPKVHAFLERIKPFLSPEDFASYRRLTLAFNGDSALETAPGDLFTVLHALKCPSNAGKSCTFAAGFASRAQEIRNLGNLASNLLTFMGDLG